jgi:hypothetical protein
MADLPIEVYGINLLVRLVPDKDAAIQLRCPKGAAMRYAEVVSRGDGFDSDGNVFRAMPHINAIVAFEEDGDEARGHSFTAADNDYRLVTLDDVLLALPPTGWRLRAK